MVRPAGFEPASPRLKGEHPGPLDEGRLGAGSENRTHTSWLEARHAPQYAMPALIWRRVESTILTGRAGRALSRRRWAPAQLTLRSGDPDTIRTCILRCRRSALIR